jgi:DNA-binding CsgD family transcriptional regulator
MIISASSVKHAISIESVTDKSGINNSQPELTARQQQILDLMQAGKVNKEIASKLGIGVGTVKQHIVALFKKLHVSNRAMAVSRGMSLQQGHENRNAALTAAQGIMERRPCVVLSIALPENANPQAVRMLHGIMAALAFDNDALFLARKGNAGDIIFGVQRVTEYDLVKALHTAQAVFADITALDSELAQQLRGGLTAGLAGASMNRFGGWSGEAIASAVIAASRDLVLVADAGTLALGRPALDLMQAFGIGSNQQISAMLPFSGLGNLRWTGERNTYGLIGRRTELAQLESALAKATKASGRKIKKVQGSLIYLEGESGMGKSRLCKAISEACVRNAGKVYFFRCLPLAASSEDIFDTLDGSAYSVEAAVKLLDKPVLRFPELLIIDDLHVLPGEKQLALAEAAAREAAKGRLVILSTRRTVDNLPVASVSILLRRLPIDAVEALVREVLGDQATKNRIGGIHAIAQLAAGVPLFAVEMARHFGEEILALPLLVVICARLDNLRLDRELLRCVARSDKNMTLPMVADEIGEDVESLRQSLNMALAVGVLTQDATGALLFTHPLLRQIIDFFGME